jgi:hypothetical protein
MCVCVCACPYRKWEEKQRVLGHQERTVIGRPRALLNVQALTLNSGSPDDDDDEDDDDDNDDDAANDNGVEDMLTGLRVPFSTRLWAMRGQVHQGYQALYVVQVVGDGRTDRRGGARMSQNGYKK